METRSRRTAKPNPRYIDSIKDVARKTGKEIIPDVTVNTSLYTSSVGATLKNGRKVKFAQSKGVERLKLNGPKADANADKSTEKRSLCMKTKIKKDKRNKVVKYHFTIDCSAIDDMDLHGLGEFIKTEMSEFRQTKIKIKKVIVTSETLFKKSNLKYWTKAYVEQHVERSVNFQKKF